MSKRRSKNDVKADEVPIVMITNERTELKANQMLMLYQAAAMAQLGYMDALNPDTGEIESLLIGVEPMPDGQIRTWPLAKFINKLSEIPKYLVADGLGNYVDKSIKPEETGTSEEGPTSPDISGDSLGGASNTTVH